MLRQKIGVASKVACEAAGENCRVLFRTRKFGPRDLEGRHPSAIALVCQCFYWGRWVGLARPSLPARATARPLPLPNEMPSPAYQMIEIYVFFPPHFTVYTRSRGRGEYPLMAKLGKFSVVSIPVFGITDTEQNSAALCQVSPLGGIRHDPVSDCKIGIVIVMHSEGAGAEQLNMIIYSTISLITPYCQGPLPKSL